MLKWALIFLVISLIAALCGFTGIAKFLFFLFVVVCLAFFIIGISTEKKVM